MEDLQTTMTSYTINERAQTIYRTVRNVYDWRQSSEIVTPYEVALKQMQECLSRGTLCVPAAGIGTYVAAAIEAGFAPHNIWAVEILPHIYELGELTFSRFGVNYVLSDFLLWKPDMQFDAIIGNPPYQKGGNSAFYVQFFRKYAELLAPGGYFSIVAPSKAAAKYTKGYKELDKLGWNGVEYGMDSHFPNIGQPIAIYKGSDKGNEKPIIEVIDGDTVTNVARGSVLPVQYVSPSKKFQEAESELTLSIFQKFYGSTDKKVRERFETLDEPPTGPYVYLSTVAWGYHPARAKGGPYAFLTYVNDQDAYYATGSRGKFMRFKTQEQADQMHWLLSRSFAYRFIVAASCRAQFLPRVLLEETPDWHGVTTDEALFEKLGFTQAEINYINLWNRVTAGK